MAFALQNFSRSTDPSNAGKSSGGEGGAAIFTYQSSTDNAATIAGANYFAGLVHEVALGDLLFVNASDAYVPLRVATLDRVAGTITTESIEGGIGSLPSGQILVGSAANVPTAVTMSGDATMTNAGVVTVAGSAPAATYQNTVTISITAADVIAAYTTPKVLVAAPAAGFRYIVTSVQYDILYGTAQFTGGGLFGVQINNTANGLGKAVHNFLAGGQLNAASENSVYTTVSTALSGDSADYVAQGIYFSNKTAAFATGDSNIDIHITYSTVATAA